jgi:hypothetical protein
MALLLMGAVPWTASAASSNGCEGGGFTVMTGTQSFSGTVDTTIAAGAVGSVLRVRGRYIEFDVDAATFSVLNYTLTGAPNALDLTGGVRTILFASKVPDLRGSTLTGGVEVQVSNDDLLLERAGSAASIKLQAKDCASGGIFQMEPARADGTPTDITHTLGAGMFYFDNPNFRNPPPLPICPPGGPFTKDCYAVAVTPRINFANDVSRRLVGRDSPQVATRLVQAATVSQWRVASGGRMGGVLGEDSTEVAPPATNCVKNCQAQNRGRGRFVNLGFPFPVPLASRIP